MEGLCLSYRSINLGALISYTVVANICQFGIQSLGTHTPHLGLEGRPQIRETMHTLAEDSGRRIQYGGSNTAPLNEKWGILGHWASNEEYLCVAGGKEWRFTVGFTIPLITMILAILLVTTTRQGPVVMGCEAMA